MSLDELRPELGSGAGLKRVQGEGRKSVTETERKGLESAPR